MNFASEDHELPVSKARSQEEMERDVREGFRQDIIAGFIDGGLNDGS